MPVSLPTPLIITLNVVGWPIIQLSIAYAMFRCPSTWFASKSVDPSNSAMPALYRWLNVRAWKLRIPDAARWFGGSSAMPKALGRRFDAQHARRLIAETRRGEIAHWLMMLAAPVFFVWNPPWADAVMVAYALAANAPCIVVQRFNRRRLTATIASACRLENATT